MLHHDHRVAQDTAYFGLLLALILAGCATRPTPTSAPPSVAPSQVADATPVPRCPEFSFDTGATLGPEFQSDIFVGGESEVITGQFIDGLAQLYGGGATDPCQWFTDRGLQTAIAIDPRLRDITQRKLKIEGGLLLRVAFEGTYDLRLRPPVVPIDAVFDIAAGATITDLPTRTTTITTADQRVAFHIDFIYDGHQWRANSVGPVSADNAQWANQPTPLPPGPPCSGLVRDPVGAAFDNGAAQGHRIWCDADGRGRIISQPDQLALQTRYPCNSGHAAVLTIGYPIGMPNDPLALNEYVRDPAGEFLAKGWVTAPYQGNAVPPDDAASTGWTNGNIEILVSPGELAKAIYIKRGEILERWPRAARQWGVTDCN